MWPVILLLIATSFITMQVLAQDYRAYKKEQLTIGTDSLPYRILLPLHYAPGEQYPVIFFLHGAGERGNDNEKQLIHGGKLFLKDSVRKKYPAIIIFPQCPEDSYWSNVFIDTDSATQKRSFHFSVDEPPTIAMQMLINLIDHIENNYKIKKEQVYVMGLSMGGMGTFELVKRKPDFFAAAISICGGANPLTAPLLSHTRWWIFHGAKDDVVSPEHSVTMTGALQKAGADVKFTLYPQANHNSWDTAFAEPVLFNWVFQNKKDVR